MDNNTTDIDKALAWWGNLSFADKIKFSVYYFDKGATYVDESEIFDIWEGEVTAEVPAPSPCSIEEGLKSKVRDIDIEMFPDTETVSYIRFINSGEIIGEIPTANHKYADRIVTAWNCHDDLVKALELAKDIMTTYKLMDSKAGAAIESALTKATKH